MSDINSLYFKTVMNPTSNSGGKEGGEAGHSGQPCQLRRPSGRPSLQNDARGNGDAAGVDRHGGREGEGAADDVAARGRHEGERHRHRPHAVEPAKGVLCHC